MRISKKRNKQMMRRRQWAMAAVSGALVAFLFDPARGKARRAKIRDMTLGRMRRLKRRTERTARWVGAEAHGLKEKAKHLKEEEKIYNDSTLARKVESELFAHTAVPKGDILINSEGGVISLRGELSDPDMIRRIERKVRSIHGVRGVNNLLHMKGTAPVAR